MSSSRITYIPRNDTSAEVEVAALAAVYKLIIDSQSKRDPLPDESGPGDVKGFRNDSRQNHHIR